MYAYIKGKVEYKGKNYIIIENNNIGYNVYMASSEIEGLDLEQEVKVYTYFNVKENEMTLHGFLTNEKLNIFKKLIEVSGVGPKAGKTILAEMTPEEVCLAIATSDVKMLTKVSGVGPKMAQRIILELKDKISNEQIASGANIGNKVSGESKEAIIALQVLGYSQKQAEEAVRFASESETKVENIIKKALKFILTK